MKKLLLIMAVFISCSMVYADDGDDFVRVDVLLKQVVRKTLTRTVSPIPLNCSYDFSNNYLITTFNQDVGYVTVKVRNEANNTITTDTAYSAEGVTETFLGGEMGVYTVTYEIATGDIYEGSFSIMK